LALRRTGAVATYTGENEDAGQWHAAIIPPRSAVIK
jgi:hypothetical protein